MAQSLVSKYLAQAGVKTPYEDMTSAQLEEKNKANPLSGYGFMSSQEKQQRQLQMAMFEREEENKARMMQQQLLAQMSSQQQIGHYAGAGLMGLMQHLKSRGQAPEVQADTQNDPELDRYNQLATEVGPETALEMLGQETGNASMIEQAQGKRTAKQKEQLDMENIRSMIADRGKQESKPNQTITVQRTGADGKPMQASLEIVGKGPDGRNIYRELGEAVKGSVTDTNEGWRSTSKSGVNERTKNMESALTSTANALDAYDRLEKLVKETPANGWAGTLTAKAEDVASGLGNLSKQFLTQAEQENWKGNEDGTFASRTVSAYKWDALEKFAGANVKIKSLVLELAYARAAATGDSSRSLSDRDVQNQLDQIGGQVSNPKIFLDLVKQNKEMMVSKLENLGKYSKVDGRSIGDAYADDIAGLKKRAGGNTTGSVVMYRNNKKYNIPADKVEGFKASGGTETP